MNDYLLYNVETDIGETKNVFKDHPEIARRLTRLAEEARVDLGDGDQAGKNQRPVGRVENPKSQLLQK